MGVVVRLLRAGLVQAFCLTVQPFRIAFNKYLKLVLAPCVWYNSLMPKRKETVFVAMSGGVDSSVAAALLKRDGFDVVGVYMKCWTEGEACTSQDDERSARLAAGYLGIPFYTWNFLTEYKEKVVNYMLKGYAQGITPNPDMMCNKEIKFGLFYDRAMKLGADYVATGHYARKEKRGNSFVLLKGKDLGKDQSYFLSFIRPSVLANLLFPVGNHLKSEVRAYAKKMSEERIKK